MLIYPSVWGCIRIYRNITSLWWQQMAQELTIKGHVSRNICLLLMTRFRRWCLIDDWDMAIMLFYSLAFVGLKMCLTFCSSMWLKNKCLKRKKAQRRWARMMCLRSSGNNAVCLTTAIAKNLTLSYHECDQMVAYTLNSY